MIDFDDVDTLARTLVGEADSEDREGKLLVAFTILNRWRTGYRNKTTINEVCKDRKQFSCWNEDSPGLARMQALHWGDKTYRKAIKLALHAIDAVNPLPIKVRHYYAPKAMAPAGVEPKWAIGEQPHQIHGGHRFYEGIA